VEVAEDPNFTRAFPERQRTEVAVVLAADGTDMSERADFHRGEAEHPHPPNAMRRKFLDLAAPVWGVGRAEALYDRVLDLERVPNVASLAGDAGLQPSDRDGEAREWLQGFEREVPSAVRPHGFQLAHDAGHR
jgi:hypothetical protein